jgi:hypothetical protein
MYDVRRSWLVSGSFGLVVLLSAQVTSVGAATKPKESSGKASGVCFGRTTAGVFFGRLSAPKPGVEVQVSWAVNARKYRAVGSSGPDGVVLLGRVPSGPAFARVAPSVKDAAVRTSPRCESPASGVRAAFVSALVKVVKGERSVVSVPGGVVVFPGNSLHW